MPRRSTRPALALAVLAAALAAAVAPRGAESKPAKPRVKIVKITYRAHNGKQRPAWVVLPSWYGKRYHPKLPLIISPHGRGLSGRQNARLWGALPARGPFIVVNPDGQGRRLPRHSWGYSGQIEDLARMPKILRNKLPWIQIDHRRVYAFGGSMGGQESLLLLARKPRLLAGVAVFDAVTDFAAQYKRFPQINCNKKCRRDLGEPLGRVLIRQARREIGGAPWKKPAAYKRRSPMTYVDVIARSCVPLQIWWSVADQVVRDHTSQSGAMFWRIRQLNAQAPVHAFVGNWIHTAVMKAKTRLPLALANFDLLPGNPQGHGPALRELTPRAPWWCGWGEPGDAGPLPAPEPAEEVEDPPVRP